MDDTKASCRLSEEEKKSILYIYTRVGPRVGRHIHYFWYRLLFFNDLWFIFLVSFARNVYNNDFCFLESFSWGGIICDILCLLAIVLNVLYIFYSTIVFFLKCLILNYVSIVLYMIIIYFFVIFTINFFFVKRFSFSLVAVN